MVFGEVSDAGGFPWLVRVHRHRRERPQEFLFEHASPHGCLALEPDTEQQAAGSGSDRSDPAIGHVRTGDVGDDRYDHRCDRQPEPPKVGAPVPGDEHWQVNQERRENDSPKRSHVRPTPAYLVESWNGLRYRHLSEGTTFCR